VCLASLSETESLLARALVVRKWLRDHLDLIVAHSPQLRINRSLSIGLVLASAGPVEGLRASCRLEGLPVTALRLYLLHSPAGAALLVV
jgi:hypothetical protein